MDRERKIRNLVIAGLGEQAKVCESIVRDHGLYKLRGFVDDERADECLGAVDDLIKIKEKFGDLLVFVAIGRNSSRRVVAERVMELGLDLANIVHPSAVVASTVKIGKGLFVGAGVVVNNGAALGDGVYINSGVVVEHDCVIGAFSHLAPGVVTGGGVRIGAGSFVGIGAKISDHITLGEDSFVAMGAVVTRSYGENVCLTGVPAKPKIMRAQSRQKYQ